VDNTETITHLSLCSGYEGIGLGLRRVLPNVREISYVEIEAFAIQNLVEKMEKGLLDAAPIFTNLKTFPYGKFRGCVDILSGGFPCQPFSAAGQRKGTEDPRHLFPYIKEGIRDCQPRIVFLENVEGIISSKTSDGESVLQYVLRELEGLGYVSTAGVFSASEVGAPHQRKRVFILGVRDKLGNASDLRCQQPSSDSRETGTDQSGEERGMYEPKGASPLPGHEPQPQGSQEELADTEGSKSRFKTERQGRQDSSGGSQEELADSQSEGLEGHSWLRSEQDWGCQLSEGSIWPAKPTEAQHEWEEPRVIEPKLGRAANGSTSRVDRLRLLGNGVVPATSARAFVTLINRVL
jgi:DNA (cytosine-5)-methyltransferase 1